MGRVCDNCGQTESQEDGGWILNYEYDWEFCSKLCMDEWEYWQKMDENEKSS